MSLDWPVTLLPGVVYGAKVEFGMFDKRRFATNEQVQNFFEKEGFEKVGVTGGGRTRYIEGLWSAPMKVYEQDDELKCITAIWIK